MGVPIRGSVSAFVAFACLATGAVLAGDVGNALQALESSQPAEAAQLAPAWREALARMSAVQLQALRHGAGSDSIELDGGGTLSDYIAARGLSDLPLAIFVAHEGVALSQGAAYRLAGTTSAQGVRVPGDSLAGGSLRLDPLMPGGGGISGSAQFQLTASVGQAEPAEARSAQTILRGGFWTPADATAVDSVFRNGFE